MYKQEIHKLLLTRISVIVKKKRSSLGLFYEVEMLLNFEVRYILQHARSVCQSVEGEGGDGSGEGGMMFRSLTAQDHGVQLI